MYSRTQQIPPSNYKISGQWEGGGEHFFLGQQFYCIWAYLEQN